MVSSRRKEPPPSAHAFNRPRDIAKAPPSPATQPKPSSKPVKVAASMSSLPTSHEEVCSNCRSTTVQLKHVTRSFGSGAGLMVIENIPQWSCPSCGESYFTAQTMHELERIKTLRKSIAKARSVPVARYESIDA